MHPSTSPVYGFVGYRQLLLAALLSGCGASDPPASEAGTGGGAGGGVGAGGGQASAGSVSAGATTMGAAGLTQQGGGGGAGAGGAAAGGASAAGTGGGGGSAGASGATTPQRLLLRDEGHSAVHYVDLVDSRNDWHQTVPVGRDLQLIGQQRFLIGTDNGYEERSMADGTLVQELNSYPGTLAAHRLHNGNTLLSGVDFHGGNGIVLVEVDGGGEVARQLQYPGDYVRMVRESAGGRFLVAAGTHVFEGDAEGNVVWEVMVQGHEQPNAWEALRLSSGDVIVGGGYAASLQIFGPDRSLKQTITGGNEASPFFFADVQVLANGHFVVANWQGHGTGFGDQGLQVLEYDALGELVWFWRQDASFVSSLQQVIVLDGLDLEKLHVESRETGVLEAVD